MVNNFPYTFFNKKFTEFEDTNIHIMTNCVQYGTGVFGGIRGYLSEDKKTMNIFRLDDHFKRFLKSMKIIGVDFPYNETQLKEIAIELIAKNKPNTDIYLRPFAYSSNTRLTPNLGDEYKFDYCMYMIPLGDYLPTEKGLSVEVSSWRRVSDNCIASRGKFSGAYISSAVATSDANKRGFDEAILLTEAGNVAEGAAENIFIVQNGTLITPAKTEDILEGITRKSILEMAKDLGIPTEERVVDRTELYTSDEVFFTGTGVQVSWIKKIDNRQIGNGEKGEITKKIYNLFFRIVRGEKPKYQSWITKINL